VVTDRKLSFFAENVEHLLAMDMVSQLFCVALIQQIHPQVHHRSI